MRATSVHELFLPAFKPVGKMPPLCLAYKYLDGSHKKYILRVPYHICTVSRSLCRNTLCGSSMMTRSFCTGVRVSSAITGRPPRRHDKLSEYGATSSHGPSVLRGADRCDDARHGRDGTGIHNSSRSSKHADYLHERSRRGPRTVPSSRLCLLEEAVRCRHICRHGAICPHYVSVAFLILR